MSDLHSAGYHLGIFSLITMGNRDHLATALGIKGLCGISLSILIVYFAFTPLSSIKALKIIDPSLLALH